MNELINHSQSLWEQCGWLIQIMIVLIATATLRYLQAVARRKLFPKIKSSSHGWDQALLDAVNRPVSVLIWLLGLSFSLEILMHHLDAASLEHFLYPGRRVAIIAGFLWMLLRFVHNVEKHTIRRGANDATFDKTRVHAISRIVNIITLVVGALVILQSLNFQISSVLALGGIGGLAVTFAAKDVLANFFGGLMIYFDRPFSVGDWIRSPDRNIEGTVEHIGWRSTRVRTFDKRPLYVPNGVFSNIAIENPSRMSNRRIKFVLGIRYDDINKVQSITDDIKEMLQAHDDIDSDLALWVNMTGFGPSSIDITIYTFTKTNIWIPFQMIQQDVLLKVHDIVVANKAECAFPTTTVHIPEVVTQQTVN